MGGSFSNTNRNITPGLERKDLSAVDSAILENCVVMFSTTSCKYCNKAKQSLTDFGVRFKVVELDLLGRNSFKVSSELSLKTGQRTVKFTCRSFRIGRQVRCKQLVLKSCTQWYSVLARRGEDDGKWMWPRKFSWVSSPQDPISMLPNAQY